MRLLVLTLLAICAECGAGRTCDADGNCAAPGAGGRNRGGGTAEEHAVVFHSIHAPDLAELRRLLEAGVDPDGHRGELTGATALGWSAQHGYAHVARLLQEFGADADAVDNDGRTALMASLGGHREVLAALLGAGADTDVRDKDGLTALMGATHWGADWAVAALLEAGADTELKGQGGRTALMLAADRGNLAALQLLLAAGCGLEHESELGNTALLVARGSGFAAGEQALLRAGARGDGAFNSGMAKGAGAGAGAGAGNGGGIRIVDNSGVLSPAESAKLRAKMNAAPTPPRTGPP